jgi:hypothetical protein
MVLGLTFSLYNLKRGNDLSAGIWAILLLFKPWLVWIAGLALALLVISHRKWKAIIGFIGAVAVLILTTLIVLPKGFEEFGHIDLSQTRGGVADGVYYIWPLATPTDFFTYVLKVSLSSVGKIFLWAFWIILGIALAVWAIVLWKRGNLKDEALVGVAALLGVMLSPYVRYYDYILLIIWIAAFSGMEWKCLPRWGRTGLAVSMVLALAVLYGTHPEPWVILSLLMLYTGTLFALSSLTFGNKKRDENESMNGKRKDALFRAS